MFINFKRNEFKMKLGTKKKEHKTPKMKTNPKMHRKAI